ncbi:MAG: C40 family peptidase [Candidatus Schmidhempelia sp.]|nr:C40 family peptidase [Candidatus Schmidhempelia sp.]
MTKGFCSKFSGLNLLIVVIFLTGCTNPTSSSYLQKHEQLQLQTANLILAQYQQWKKTPYVYGGNTHRGIDCSGLVVQTYLSKFNKILPRLTTDLAKVGKNVTSLKPGDLIFFKTGRGRTGLHVGIYYKDNKFLHASTKKGVEITSLQNSYWQNKYWMSRRVL